MDGGTRGRCQLKQQNILGGQLVLLHVMLLRGYELRVPVLFTSRNRSLFTHGLCQPEQEILTGLYRDSVTEQLFTSAIKQKSLCLRIILAKGFKRLQVLRLNPGGVFYFNGPK